ncbi:hypothetical protein [Tenacibaculum litoreum]|uniref:hypothetical protein n=1 Tax=Tenacibaculum litoreum TaxID=321269 RepID=UPI0038B5AEC6
MLLKILVAQVFYVVAYKENNTVVIKYIEVRAYDYSLTKFPEDFINLGAFSGSFRYFNEKGKLENSEAFIEGYLIKASQENYLPVKRNTLQKAKEEGSFQARVQPCTEVPSILYIHETTHHYKDYYKASYRVDSSGNIIEGSMTVADVPYKSIYLGSTTQTYTYTSFSCDTPDTGDSIYKSEYMREQILMDCGPGYDNVTYNGYCVDTEEQIINKLDGKANCIFNKLKNLNLFKATIKKFENSETYNLTLQSGNNCQNTSVEACTDAEDLENGNITINFQSLGNNNLGLAASILHEGIHAEIYKYVDEHKKGIDPNNRPNVLYYYNYFKAQNALDQGTTYAQHEHMQDKYVIPIAQAIRKLDNYKYPLEEYLGFGWDGLKVYKYDTYLDANGKEQTMTPEMLDKITKKSYNIAASSNFGLDCK